MSVRTPVLFALVMLGLTSVGFSADAFAPKTFSIERYEPVWKRSPFIVETVAGPGPNVGLVAKYALVGMASVAGNPLVFLVDKTNMDAAKNRFTVSKGKASEQGVELIEVVADADPRKSSAKIRQGAEQATLFFDASSLAPTGPNLVPGAVPPPPSAMVRPPNIPLPPTAQPAPLPSGANGTPQIPNAPAPARRIIRPAPVNLSN